MYIAPLGPFLDPGSRAFEHPELSHHRHFTTLEDHRRAPICPTWRKMLGYDTDWMTRDDIVTTTYEAGGALNDLKLRSGLIDADTHATVARHFEIALRTFPHVDAIAGLPEEPRRHALHALADEVQDVNTASLVGDDELKWRSSIGFRVGSVLARHTAVILPASSPTAGPASAAATTSPWQR